jgi:cytochrome c-type biogenesis protein CcmH
MTFWIIIIAMATLVVLLLGLAMRRADSQEVPDAAAYDLRVYRDQLAEVAREVDRGVVTAEDAERARTEISRRILAADAGRAREQTVSPGPKRGFFIFVLVIVLGGSIALYAYLGQPGYGDLALQDRIDFAEQMRANRPDQQTAEQSLPPFPEAEGVSQAFKDLMVRLREAVAARPDDLQGHVLLAQNEARLGNFSAAAEMQNRALQLKGDTITAEDITDYAEFLVLAAGGYVSPEAEAALRAALRLDENDGRARYYIGLMMVQSGRPDIAFRIWDALLRRGPAEAVWIEPIKAQIMSVADFAGVTYSMPAIGAGDTPGPDAADIEAAAEMSTEERMEMIGGMVQGLSNRLATEGGPPQDWARLITSLAVLGDPDQALAIYNNATEVFANNPGALDVIRAAGSQAGVAE